MWYEHYETAKRLMTRADRAAASQDWDELAYLLWVMEAKLALMRKELPQRTRPVTAPPPARPQSPE